MFRFCLANQFLICTFLDKGCSPVHAHHPFTLTRSITHDATGEEITQGCKRAVLKYFLKPCPCLNSCTLATVFLTPDFHQVRKSRCVTPPDPNLRTILASIFFLPSSKSHLLRASGESGLISSPRGV